jgi:methanogenic corrinoid protein MtbC1
MSPVTRAFPQVDGIDRLADALPIPRDVAEAYDAVRSQVVARVDGALFRRPDLGVLMGDAPATVVRELNRHVSALLASVLTLGVPELLTCGLPRMLTAYRGRGLSPDYLEILPELWTGALEDQMGPRSGPIVRVLDWMARYPEAWIPGEDTLPDTEAPADADRLCGTLLSGDGPGARSVLKRAMDQGSSLPDVFVDLVQPALYEIGHRWEEGRITAAQEHLASALVARVLAGLEHPPEAQEGGIAVVTTAPTETHEFGAWMAADVLRSAGWTVHFLGSQLPVEECLHYLRGIDCDLLAVSVTLEIHLPSLQRLIGELRDDPGLSRIPVLVGGQAFSGGERVWRTTGADGMATDAREVVAQARRLAAARAARTD